jgi:hypothetical protein
MRRLGVAVGPAVLALSMLLQGGMASAVQRDVEWCAEDPVLIVFGAQFKVVTTVQAPPSAVSSFAYFIQVPQNAVGRTIVNWPNSKLSTTTVQINYTGDAWSGSGPFTVSGTVSVSAPSGSAVTVSVSGPTVASQTFSSLSFSTSVTPNGAASDQSSANAQ